jgi:hypothetical protein
MIDNFSLALTHGLLILAAWRMLRRGDLDREGAAEKPSRWGRHKADAPDA